MADAWPPRRTVKINARPPGGRTTCVDDRMSLYKTRRLAMRCRVRLPRLLTRSAAGWFTFPPGLSLVHDWVTGEVRNDPLTPGGMPGQEPRSARSRVSATLIPGKPSLLSALSLTFTWPRQTGDSQPSTSTTAA